MVWGEPVLDKTDMADMNLVYYFLAAVRNHQIRMSLCIPEEKVFSEEDFEAKLETRRLHQNQSLPDKSVGDIGWYYWVPSVLMVYISSR